MRKNAAFCNTSIYYNTRRFTISKDTPTQQTHAFLLSLGYSDAVSKGMIDALIQNGISHSSLLGMVKGLAGRYEVGEDAGLETLAASVKKELENEQGKAKLKVWFLPSTGWSSKEDDGLGVPTIHSMDRAFPVEVTEGTNLADVARFGTSENCDVLREYLECACNGIMACSTCHVVIHPEWFDSTRSSDDEVSASGFDQTKIGTPSEPEQDMIDLAFEPQSTSRLGCQITLTKALDGLVILLPEGSNNLMDSIPFEG
jgi:2Fe-2S ferredoxin